MQQQNQKEINITSKQTVQVLIEYHIQVPDWIWHMRRKGGKNRTFSVYLFYLVSLTKTIYFKVTLL